MTPKQFMRRCQVHGTLLGVRGNPTHESQMKENGIGQIDLVVLNLYAFEHTVAQGSDFGTCELLELEGIPRDVELESHRYPPCTCSNRGGILAIFIIVSSWNHRKVDWRAFWCGGRRQ